ncbi:MAG: metal ABC transporter permease [Elusimicrobia bacterium]|nr:metal ABC transporter permease [Elusimicrobiota bacterium]
MEILFNFAGLSAQPFLIRAFIASGLCAISCAIVGVWVFFFKIPFVALTMAHAAFAGAVIGIFFGLNPVVSAVVFCLAAAFFIAPLAQKGNFSANASTSIIFSFMLGLAFLFMALIQENRALALSLMWGSPLTVSVRDIYFIAACAAAVLTFLVVFNKGIIAVIFSRDLAKASGIAEKPIFYALIILCALSVSVNISGIGGLLIYSLITIPTATAYQFSQKIKPMYFLSALFALAACWLGLLASYIFNLPTGASVVLMACLIFFISLCFAKNNNHYK